MINFGKGVKGEKTYIYLVTINFNHPKVKRYNKPN